MLYRFTDGASRRHAKVLVDALLKRGGAVAAKSLAQSLHDAFHPWRSLAPSSASAKTAAAALKWTAAVYGSVE